MTNQPKRAPNQPPAGTDAADAADAASTAEMDGDYWNHYYSSRHPSIAGSTTFARFCAERMEPGSSLYELGCGNGRDALFFAHEGHRVIACDRSSVAIGNIGKIVSEREFAHPPELVVGEMGALPATSEPLDIVYSRFTLHAVTVGEASHALDWSHRNLNAGGRLFIEVRSVLGSLCGKGEEVAPDTFLYNEHTRRFVRREALVSELEELGFEVLECIESDGLAVHKDDDPVVIRVIARKR